MPRSHVRERVAMRRTRGGSVLADRGVCGGVVEGPLLSTTIAIAWMVEGG